MYQETQKGMSGSPLWLMTAQGNFIIGVHTVSEEYGQSNGTLFYDDKGLIDIFGYETIKEFIRKIPEYKTKQQSQTGNFKYWAISTQDQEHGRTIWKIDKFYFWTSSSFPL